MLISTDVLALTRLVFLVSGLLLLLAFLFLLVLGVMEFFLVPLPRQVVQCIVNLRLHFVFRILR